MQSYKDFKKEYLTEWVDRSQAARKAAEELANKDTTSLRDKYGDKRFILDLGDRKIEFKDINETNDEGLPYFPWNEAMRLFGEPDEDGWRLPTSDELKFLSETPSVYRDDARVFKGILYLPFDGQVVNGTVRKHDGYYGDYGIYWTSSTSASHKECADTLFVSPGRKKLTKAGIGHYNKVSRLSVRLVRDVK